MAAQVASWLKDFRHRNFPIYTVWGLFIAATGIVSMATYGSWSGVPVFLIVTAVGLWLVRKGWVVSGERPRR